VHASHDAEAKNSETCLVIAKPALCLHATC